MLSKGAGSRDALAFAQAVDGAGGSLSFGSSREAIVANAIPGQDSGLMLSLLADALLRPALQPAEFDKAPQTRAIDGLANARTRIRASSSACTRAAGCSAVIPTAARPAAARSTWPRSAWTT